MRVIVYALIVSSLIFISSCQPRFPTTPTLGMLEKVELTDLKGIPAEYGELVAVTAHAEYEGWSQLWFVDDNLTIRMVRIQFHVNRINKNVLVIPRN